MDESGFTVFYLRVTQDIGSVTVRITTFGQAKKRTQSLPVADCTTLNGNVTRTGDICENRISKSAPGTKINVRNGWDFVYIGTPDKQKD